MKEVVDEIMTKKSKAAVAATKEEPVVRDIPTSHVLVNGGTQMRTCLNDAVVQEYMDRMAAGDEFPPIVVFQEGDCYWLADGFHRFRAKRATYAETIRAEIRAGNQSDAIEYAVGANKTNGLRRTNADKQMAVRAALAHERLRTKSDDQIAEIVGVHRTTVLRMRVGEPPQPVQSTGSSQLLETATAQDDGEAKPQQGRRSPSGNFPSRVEVPSVGAKRVGRDGKVRRLPRNRKVAASPSVEVAARAERTALPPLPDGPFGLIYAEPSWRSREGLVEVSYEGRTWSAADLCALDVKAIVEEESALCLWAPCSHLADALKVMKAWGFTYQTALIYDRERPKHGREHRFHIPTVELLLIGTRGLCFPADDERPLQVEAFEPRGASTKTNYHRDLVRRMFPERRRVLLLGTTPAPPEWDAWGIETIKNAA